MSNFARWVAAFFIGLLSTGPGGHPKVKDDETIRYARRFEPEVSRSMAGPRPGSPPLARPVPAWSVSPWKITCYTLRGRTATGTTVGLGQVAVDPRLVPLGRILVIEGMGSFRATDTGGAVKGPHADVWMSDTSACLRFGVQHKRVYTQ